MRPTVETRRSSESEVELWNDTGLVSVMPYAIVTSLMCISETTRFIVSIGQGEPAMMPVRRDDKSNSANRAWSSSAMNIVGTPCSAVQRSWATAASVATGSKTSPGKTIAAPTETQASVANTMPKQ
jgi:hypothetical protein